MQTTIRHSDSGFTSTYQDYDPATRGMIEKTTIITCSEWRMVDCTNQATIEYETPRTYGSLNGTFTTWRCQTHALRD